MCGIAGILSDKQPPSREEIQKMTGCLTHRGPDAAGFFMEGPVALGHRRLSILDLSEEANQPMTSHNGRYVMVYNGEVYNFREIARKLDRQWLTKSDSEVILEAFVQWGADCASQFNGMFAMAIWDKQEEALYLSRDRLGIKPLFVYQKKGVLGFASELKAIKACQDTFDLSTNQQAISDFLHLGYIPAPATMYKEVEKFPAGSWGTYKDGKLSIRPYWELSDQVGKETINDLHEAKAHYKDLLESSIHYRMISDVPLGTFLSGGIDSSLVTAVAQQQSDRPIHTFSIGFDYGKYDESSYAEKVAEALGTEHHAFRVTAKDAQELIPEVINVYDEPFADSSFVPTMLVSRLARQQVTVALSGDGGDELFHGYGMYHWAERLRHPLVNMLHKPAAKIFSQLSDRYKRVGQLLDYNKEDDLYSHLFSQEQYFFRAKEIAQLKPGLPVPSRYAPPNLPRQFSPAEAQAFFDLQRYLPDDLLVKVDRASMHHSLEVRVPLLDHRLVAFALNLSPALKISGHTLKYFLKEVLADYLPRQLFDRPKWGFSIPLRFWLKDELRFLLEEHLSVKAVKNTGIVDPTIVEKMKSRYLKGDTYLFNRLWALIVLQQFLKK